MPLTQFARPAAALSLAFALAAQGGFPASASATPLTSATTASTILKDIEAQANATAPKLRVVIVDPDEINLTTINNSNRPTQKLYAYMQARGIDLRRDDFSALSWGMGAHYGPNSSNPQAQRFSTSGNKTGAKDICVIIPETADLSSRSLVEKWVGRAGPTHQIAALDPGAYAMMARVAWHEAWHCLDDEFVLAYETMDSDKGFEFAHAIHRAEMFADVAATLTMASKGNLSIIQDTSDARAISSRWNGPKMMDAYMPQYDAEYYSGITYYTTPAHDAVLRHIQTVGIDVVSRYTLQDIHKIAADVTRKQALSATEFRAVASFLKRGNNYVEELRRQAARGNKTAARNLDFIAAYSARTEVARDRLVTPTTKPVIPLPDVVPPTAEMHLNDATQAEKNHIRQELAQSINAVRASGGTAQQGVLARMEEWRHDLHTDPNRRPDLERRLYITGLMLGHGLLDDLLQAAPPAPQPDSKKPAPQI